MRIIFLEFLHNFDFMYEKEKGMPKSTFVTSYVTQMLRSMNLISRFFILNYRKCFIKVMKEQHYRSINQNAAELVVVVVDPAVAIVVNILTPRSEDYFGDLVQNAPNRIF